MAFYTKYSGWKEFLQQEVVIRKQLGLYDVGHLTRIFNSNGKSWEATGDHIQDAIDELGGNAGVVFIPFNKGVPLLTDALAFGGRYQFLKGFGWYRPTIKLNDGVNAYMLSFQANCGVEGIQFDGNKNNNSAVYCFFCASTDVTLRNVAIFYPAGHGIYASRVLEAIGVTVEFANKSGWYMTGVTDLALLYNCGAVGCAENGFLIYGNRKILSSCYGLTNYYSGFVVDSSKGGGILNTLNGVEAYNNKRHGISLLGAKRNAIHGLVYNNSQEANNTYDGINLADVDSEHSLYNIIQAQIFSDHATKNHRYSIYEVDVNQNYNTVKGSILDGAITDDLLLQGANSHAVGTHELNNQNGNAAVWHA